VAFVVGGGPRQMTIYYEPQDFNEITVLFRWRGTVLPMVLCRPAVWVLVSTHVAFLYLHLYRPEVDMPPMPWKLVGVPTSLLTFFLVFFSGNCFTRYYNLYKCCTGMSGCCMAYCGLLRVHFPHASSDELFNLSRHCLASVYILYFALSGGASDGGQKITDSEWSRVLQTGLIAQKEMMTLRAFRGFRPFLCQVWGLRALADYIQANKETAPTAALMPFQKLVLDLRQHCDDIVATLGQPVPFPYYHTLTLMLSLNLLLMAYAMIEFNSVMTIPCFFIICLVCLGLKETAVALTDPFGDDQVDFDTDAFMSNMLEGAKHIISPSAEFSTVNMPLVVGHKAIAAAKAL